MNNKLKALLEKLGLETEVISVLESNDAAKIEALNVDEVYNELFDGFKNTLRNDQAFMADVNSKVRSEVLSSKERKIMKLAGVTKEEYDALPQSTKFDSLIELTVKKLKEQSGGGDANEDIKKLNAIIVEKDEAIRKFNEEVLPSKEKEWSSMVENMKIGRFMEKELAQHKIIGSPEFILMAAEQAIKSKYDLKLDGDNIRVLKKGTELDEVENHKPVKFGDIFKRTLEAAKVIRQSNAKAGEDDDNSGKKGGGSGDDVKPLFPGAQKALDKAKENGKVDKSKLFGE